MKTDEIVELAARNLCEVRGLDPYEKIMYRGENGSEILHKFQWELLVPEIRSHIEREYAIKNAAIKRWVS